jgi:hypothetical protein
MARNNGGWNLRGGLNLSAELFNRLADLGQRQLEDANGVLDNRDSGDSGVATGGQPGATDAEIAEDIAAFNDWIEEHKDGRPQ